MKKVILTIGLILASAIPAYAQWGSGIDIGPVIKHRDQVGQADTWFQTSQTAITSTALELRGYEKVRADYDAAGTSTGFSVNLMCSNDSIWVSGSTISVTTEKWAVYDLMGCKDYNFYVGSVSNADNLTIYLTPYNLKK